MKNAILGLIIGVFLCGTILGGYIWFNEKQQEEQRLAEREQLHKDRQQMFSKLESLILYSDKWSREYSLQLDKLTKKCVAGNSFSQSCFDEMAGKSLSVTSSLIGYSRGELERKTQELIYQLRQSGLSGQEIRTALNSKKIKSTRGSMKGLTAYMFGDCCDGKVSL